MPIQVKRGTAASAVSSNPVLAAGEPGFETDTEIVGFGNGSTAWESLAKLLNTKGAALGWSPVADGSPAGYSWQAPAGGFALSATVTANAGYVAGIGSAS